MGKTQTPVTRRKFLRALAAAAGSSLAGMSGLSFYSLRLEPHWIDLERITVRLPGLHPAWRGLRIAQLSDLHRGSLTTLAQIGQAAAIAQAEAPDLIVLTGDYVTGKAQYAAELMPVLARLRAPLGVYAVLGNHDQWADAGEVSHHIKRAGVRLLPNTAVALERAGQPLWLAGVDDVWEGCDDLPAALRGVPPAQTVILLAHEPDFADTAAGYGVTLQLSGHSHGGQVRLPGVGGPVLPRLAHKYPIGLNRAGETLVYTNRGVGMHPLGIRFNCRPEVTSIILV